MALAEEDKLFIKENTIGKRLSCFWQKSGVRAGKHVSRTAYRKSVATSSHEKAPGDAETVQKVLGHSKKSFECRYVRTQCTTTGSKGMDVIAAVTSVDPLHSKLNTTEQQQEAAEEKTVDDEEIMPPTPPPLTQHKIAPVVDTSEAEEPDPKVASPVYPSPAASKTSSDNPPLLKKKHKHATCIDSSPAASKTSSEKPLPFFEKQKGACHVDSPAAASQTSPDKLPLLQEKHKLAIKELFHDSIEKRQPQELKVVRNKMCTRMVLRSFALTKRRVK